MTERPPTIRLYRPDDRPAVAALVLSTLREFGLPDQLGSIEADLDAFAERYCPPRGAFFVAELDEAFAGTVAIRPKNESTCELKRLYLHGTARGRGLGQRLYEHAEAFARAAGYTTIWLDSSRRFSQARRLYERNGFVLLDELENDWEDNVYEKRLPHHLPR
ncbi:MAG: GNAT family N-acetyltransferase [Polyangiales bacterium]